MSKQYPFEADFLNGLIFSRQRKTDEARKAFERSLELSPNNLQVILRLVELDLANREFDSAMQHIAEPLKKNPNEPALRAIQARIQLAQGNTNQAEVTLSGALNVAPKTLPLYAMLARIQWAQGHTNEAEATLQNAVEAIPKSIPTYMALASLQLAQRDTNHVEATLKKAIQAVPEVPDPYFALVEVYRAQERRTKALQVLDELGKQDFTNALLFARMGLIQEQMQEYAGARKAYEKALALQPGLPEVVNNLAYLDSEQFNEIDKAYELVTKYRSALMQQPESADTVGWVLYRHGDYTYALSVLQDCVSKKPDQPEMVFHLGIVQYMLGQEQAARETFQRSLKIKKDFVGHEEAQTCLALLDMKPDQVKADSVPSLQKRLSQQPGDPVALTRFVAVQERAGNLDKAAQACEQALKANPKCLPILTTTAALYGDRLGQVQKGLDLAKTARSMAPDDAQVAHLLGRLAFRSHDPRLALSFLQDSAQRLPDAPEVMFDLALARYSNGRIAASVSTMSNALAHPKFLHKEAGQRFLELSTLYTDASRLPSSQTRLQQVLKDDPDYLPALMALGVSQEQKKDITSAKQTYEKILTLSPVFAPAIRQLALLTAQMPNQEKQAYDLGVRAREVYRDDAELARMLGVVCYKRGDYAGTVQYLSPIAPGRSKDAELFYYLGMGQYQLKATKESVQSLQQALALDLPAPLAAQARETLAKLK